MTPPRRLVAYGFAAGLAILAIAFTVALGDLMSRTLFMAVFVAVAFSAWYGGAGPAFLCTVLGVLGIDYFMLAPTGSLGLGFADAVRAAAFMAVALVITRLATSERDARLDESAARSEAEAAAHRARFLADASAALAATHEYEPTLRVIAEQAVPEIADWCAVDLLRDDGRLARVAVAHRDPGKVALARELEERYPPSADAPAGVPAVIRTGMTQFLPVITGEMLSAVDDPEHLALVQALGLHSAIIAPMITRSGRTIGAITFVTAESRRGLSNADVVLTEDLARRAAMAVETATLVRDLEESRHQLEYQAIQLEEQAAELEAQTEELQTTVEEAEHAQRRAEEANRAKSEFLATMSHELRTPLNAIGGYTQLMELELQGPLTEEQKLSLGRIARNSRHLLALINNVLNFARLEAGQVRYTVENVPVDATIGSMEALVEPLIRTNGIHYVHERCDPSLAVRADREKVEQILLNLLTNAIKFTPSGGSIFVRCEEDEPHRLRLVVEDTGPGVPPEQEERIFEPFTQLEPRRIAATEGVGLGLSISRDLARAMGGDLAVRRVDGRGASFVLALPRASPATP